MNKVARKHMKLCAVVLYIALACTCVFSSVLSYYSVTRSAAADAKIAIYAMGVSSADSGNGFNHTLSNLGTINSSRVYTIKNSENSEVSQVAMSYKLVVTLGASLPSGTTMSLRDDTANSTITPAISGNTYTYTSDNWKFSANTAESRQITLTVTTDNSSNAAVSSGSGISITVSVISEQIS